jgi:NADPH-dependent 2,4-dienoyl-CoA reductase/sulfur reductase-like enzyme
VAVVGAGPAGLCAAIQLAELGVEVAVFDEKPAAGGQLFKQVHKFFGSGRHLAGVRGFQIGNLLLERCRELGVPILLNTAVWGVYPDRTVAANAEGRLLECRPKAVILATGAGENSIAFPGWTLPGIMGAGAAQTLVNYYRVRPGERALVVGAGNVGLIVAYQLLQAGIEVAGVAEVTESIGGYFVHAAKVRRMGVPFFMKHTVLRAEGEEKVRSCTLAEVDQAGGTIPDSEKLFEVDLVLIAVGLSPAVELCRAMGLAVTNVPELGGYLPVHNAALATSLPGVFAAGDLTGVEEASSAMEEGRLAAVTAAAYAGALPAPRAQALQGELLASLGKLRAGPFGSLIARKKTGIFREFEERHG